MEVDNMNLVQCRGKIRELLFEIDSMKETIRRKNISCNEAEEEQHLGNLRYIEVCRKYAEDYQRFFKHLKKKES